jgi:hypothetical protein
VRQLIVGDIHGCYAELSDLLAERLAGLSAEDEIIALGHRMTLLPPGRKIGP